MCTIHTKSVNDVMRNTNFGGTNINEIPLKGSGFSTTLSSYSNFIDDVYLRVEPILSIMWIPHYILDLKWIDYNYINSG